MSTYFFEVIDMHDGDYTNLTMPAEADTFAEAYQYLEDHYYNVCDDEWNGKRKLYKISYYDSDEFSEAEGFVWALDERAAARVASDCRNVSSVRVEYEVFDY